MVWIQAVAGFIALCSSVSHTGNPAMEYNPSEDGLRFFPLFLKEKRE